jgi:hypothetical protein
MKVPHVDQAIVPRRKIVDYLLSESHPDGQSKAHFFRIFGFCSDEWEVLARALHDHAKRNEVSHVEESPFGTRFVVEGIIETPINRQPWVRSIWFIDNDESVPRLVSAYPLQEVRDD